MTVSNQNRTQLSDDLVRRVVRAVNDRLSGASSDVVEVVVTEVLRAVGDLVGPVGPARDDALERQGGGSATPVASGLLERLAPRGGLRPADLLATRAGEIDHCALCRAHEARTRRRAVCTTTGRNRPGIVATVARVIAESGGDILDIAQTLVGDYFTMIIVLDTTALEQNGISFAALRDRLVHESEALGVHTVVMHEDVMNALQRV